MAIMETSRLKLSPQVHLSSLAFCPEPASQVPRAPSGRTPRTDTHRTGTGRRSKKGGAELNRGPMWNLDTTIKAAGLGGMNTPPAR